MMADAVTDAYMWDNFWIKYRIIYCKEYDMI